MRKPIYVKTHQEDLIALVTFHSDDEVERKNACASLITEADLVDDGKSVDMSRVSFSEMKLTSAPESLQLILKEDFNDIKDDSVLLMRFFHKEEDGSFSSIVFNEEETNE